MFFIASFTDALPLLQYQRHAQEQSLWIRGIVEVNRVENGSRHSENSSGISSAFEYLNIPCLMENLPYFCALKVC
jgi:hypothetical protein